MRNWGLKKMIQKILPFYTKVVFGIILYITKICILQRSLALLCDRILSPLLYKNLCRN